MIINIEMFNLYVPLQYCTTNRLHDRDKMFLSYHTTGSLMVDPV